MHSTITWIWFFIFIPFFLGSCTTIHPRGDSAPIPLIQSFSHAGFGQVLTRFVDEKGRVDYGALQRNPDALEAYYQLVATYSPDSHPGLFPTESDRLAYWINAYNAAVIKTVLTYYPIASVGQVEAPTLFFFIPENSGFFYFQQPLFGGEKINLYNLEKKIIRPRFKEPRIHFALNCASGSCPRLPRWAFSAGNLEGELEGEARRFVAEERNVRLDHQEKTIFLSSIFNWYESDFLDWFRQQHSGQEATLVNYIRLYVESEKAAELGRYATAYKVRFNPYDWSLNAQK